MAVTVKMRPLSERQYAKETFRASQAALSYPEKSSIIRYIPSTGK